MDINNLFINLVSVYFIYNLDWETHLLRMSLARSLAIFLTSPIPMSISFSLEFDSLNKRYKSIAIISPDEQDKTDLLSRPSSIAAALFSLAQMTKVKPNCCLYLSL